METPKTKTNLQIQIVEVAPLEAPLLEKARAKVPPDLMLGWHFSKLHIREPNKSNFFDLVHKN